jgi:hypothetical protein
MVQLLRRLKQLATGSVERQLAHVQNEHRLLNEQLEQLRVRHFGLDELLEQLRVRHFGLDGLLDQLRVKHIGLEEQLDLLKSSLEVPEEWFDEFQQWKRNHPIPANPLVSVCVATYNRSNLLTSRCLPSLCRQTYRNLEIIVVGDGCTDDTAIRIAQLRDPRIRFENLAHRGRYPEEPNRRWMVAGTIPVNRALDLAEGDFVTHLDDDDEHDPERVQKLVDFARKNELDFIWHPFLYQTAEGNWLTFSCDSLRYAQVTTSSIFYRRWLKRVHWDIKAHMLGEPGDWNRVRKFRYLGVNAGRHPDVLLRHYAERMQEANIPVVAA